MVPIEMQEQWGYVACFRYCGLLFEWRFCDRNPAHLSESLYFPGLGPGIIGYMAHFVPLEKIAKFNIVITAASCAQNASALGLSNRSGRIFLWCSPCHPYRIAIVRELSELVFNCQMNKFLFEIVPGMLWFFSGEACFYLCGSISKQNMR